MDLETLFLTKLRDVKQKILSSYPVKEIREELEKLCAFTSSSFQDLEFLKKLDIILDALLISRVLKDTVYTNGLLLVYLNRYTAAVKAGFYTAWSLVFSKVLSDRIPFLSPAVLSGILKVRFETICAEYNKEELQFPLEKELDLQDFIGRAAGNLLDILSNSSSYSLFINSPLRNALVMYLYEQYREKGSLSVWMPCAGIGIEPLLVIYSLGLLNETETGKAVLKNVHFVLSDHTAMCEEGIRVNPLKEFILRIKEDFSQENGLNPSDIKTTIKNIRKSITFDTSDLIYAGQVPEKSFDFVILNAGKLADYTNFKQKIAKLLNKIANKAGNTKVIIELLSQLQWENRPLELGTFESRRMIAGCVTPGSTDSQTGLFEFILEKEQANRQDDKKSADVNTLFENLDTLSPEEIKKMIKKITPASLKDDKELIRYARLLSFCGLYSKAYDIIKEKCTVDYALSYTILKEIETGCKNKKLAARTARFIIENRIKEKGFSAELLDAIVDEIDEYLEENSDSILNETEWL